ncbi:MAG: response regulator [Chloroflexi bacterium]|nr:response regulator [Chloroflexota bacterium]
MRQQVDTRQLNTYASVGCPAQVLVVDRPGGPAHVLMDTVSLLAEREVSITFVEDHVDAQRALDFYVFDLVVVGLEVQHLDQVVVLRELTALDPRLKVMVVGREMPHFYRRKAYQHGARQVLDVPQRAADLKALVWHMTHCYLRVA